MRRARHRRRRCSLMAVLAPLLADASRRSRRISRTGLRRPAPAHWFGTDELGRDIWSPHRLRRPHRRCTIVAAGRDRWSLRSGSLIGTVAGYLGGWVDAVLMRITDIFLAFPRLILALAFVAALGPGHRERRDRHRAHRLAALCAHRARRDADHRATATSSAPSRLQGASPARIILAPHRAAVPVLA